jgi:replicative superfamily II helicase
LKNPKFYELEGNENAQIKDFLNKTVQRVFQELHESKCIETHKGEDGKTYVVPTELGFIASSYYLKSSTVRKFHDTMGAGMDFPKLLRLMSEAEEFKETPLRHKEDIHNK